MQEVRAALLQILTGGCIWGHLIGSESQWRHTPPRKKNVKSALLEREHSSYSLLENYYNCKLLAEGNKQRTLTAVLEHCQVLLFALVEFVPQEKCQNCFMTTGHTRMTTSHSQNLDGHCCRTHFRVLASYHHADVYLFGSLKDSLRGHQCANHAVLQNAMCRWLWSNVGQPFLAQGPFGKLKTLRGPQIS
jgi:hypothetical protein